MKQCATCGERKPESRYNFRNKAKDIRWGTCKACQSKQRKRVWSAVRTAIVERRVGSVGGLGRNPNLVLPDRQAALWLAHRVTLLE